MGERILVVVAVAVALEDVAVVVVVVVVVVAVVVATVVVVVVVDVVFVFPSRKLDIVYMILYHLACMQTLRANMNVMNVLNTIIIKNDT